MRIYVSWDSAGILVPPLVKRQRTYRLHRAFRSVKDAMGHALWLMADGRKNVMVWLNETMPAKRQRWWRKARSK